MILSCIVIADVSLSIILNQIILSMNHSKHAVRKNGLEFEKKK